MSTWIEDQLQQLMSPVTAATLSYTGWRLVTALCVGWPSHHLVDLRRANTLCPAWPHKPVCCCVCGSIRRVGTLWSVRQKKVCSRNPLLLSLAQSTMPCSQCRATLSSCVISIVHGIVTNIIAGAQVYCTELMLLGHTSMASIATL